MGRFLSSVLSKHGSGQVKCTAQTKGLHRLLMLVSKMIFPSLGFKMFSHAVIGIYGLIEVLLGATTSDFLMRFHRRLSTLSLNAGVVKTVGSCEIVRKTFAEWPYNGVVHQAELKARSSRNIISNEMVVVNPPYSYHNY